MKKLLLTLAAASTLLLLSACGSKEPSAAAQAEAAAAAAVMEADLAATLAAQPEFYRLRTIAELPADLTWEDGADLPEFADLNAKPGGTLRSFITDFPRTLRTIGPDATGGIRPYMLDHVGVPFINRHPDVPGGNYPGLAEAWATEPATRTVYIKLDRAARWSDGTPITTADVLFTFYFMRSPLLREPWYNDYYTKTYSALHLFDEHTFALTLTEWKPDAVIRAGNIVPYPRHAFQDFGADWIENYQWRTLPTTGAYQILDRNIERGRAITLTAVENWWAREKRFWRGRFNPARYRLEVIRDPDKAFESFVRGDIDFFPMGVPKFWYENLPDTHPDVAAGYITKTKFFNEIPRPDFGLWINSDKIPNRDLREGLHFATNWDLVCEQYFRGDAVRLQTRSDGYGWRTHPTLTARPFNPTRARELFAEAGYTAQGPDGILRTPAGQRLSFTLTSYSQATRDMLPILQQEARKAGLEYNIEILDTTTGWKKVQEKGHEIAFAALARSVELYPRFWEMYHGSNAYEDAYLLPDGTPTPRAAAGTPNPAPARIRTQTNNMTMTFNPALDRLIEAYDRSSTLEEIQAIAAQIEQVIYDEASWINGYALPFHRTAAWRHVKWPASYNARQSRTAEELFLHWIDEGEKAALDHARRSGEKFEPQVRVIGQATP